MTTDDLAGLDVRALPAGPFIVLLPDRSEESILEHIGPRLVRALAELTERSDFLVVESDDLAIVDVDAMREHGWVRADEGVRCGVCGEELIDGTPTVEDVEVGTSHAHHYDDVP